MRLAKPALMAAMALACCLWACKPTEQSYRAAYEAAMAGRRAAADSIGDDGMQPMAGADAASQAEIGGVRVGVVRQYVAVTPDGGGINEYVKRYCVVAARFKQKFNALSMRERLVENGYPGAFVVHTGAPEYFVVAGSTSSAEQAAELVRRLEGDTACPPQRGCPQVLMPLQLK